jgi:hypothetical protein
LHNDVGWTNYHDDADDHDDAAGRTGTDDDTTRRHGLRRTVFT